MWCEIRKAIKERLADLHIHVWVVEMSEGKNDHPFSRDYFLLYRSAIKYYKWAKNADFTQDWYVTIDKEIVFIFQFDEIQE